MGKTFKLILSVIICEAAGIIAAPFAASSIPAWYAGLNKPIFSPPNWLFAPVWTILYLMMGVAFYLIWEKGFKNKKNGTAIFYFFAKLFLNFIWSILFFGLRSPLLGLIDIILLWLMVLITMVKFYGVSKPAAYLLIPYLIWVSFASLLNFSILILNL